MIWGCHYFRKPPYLLYSFDIWSLYIFEILCTSIYDSTNTYIKYILISCMCIYNRCVQYTYYLPKPGSSISIYLYICFLCYAMFLLFSDGFHACRFTECLGFLQCQSAKAMAARLPPFETVPRWMMMMQYQTHRQCLRRWRDDIFRCHQTLYLWISWLAGVTSYMTHKKQAIFWN